jgi:hypothetical protein
LIAFSRLQAWSRLLVTGKSTPAEIVPLGKNETEGACAEQWSYPSVVGMMMYLASNSRPDIAFAVHQCARFTHAPNRSHEKALKRIAHYLLATQTRGMIIKPTEDLTLDLYADADFAGLWNAEDANDPVCVPKPNWLHYDFGWNAVVVVLEVAD